MGQTAADNAGSSADFPSDARIVENDKMQASVEAMPSTNLPLDFIRAKMGADFILPS